MSLHLKLHVNRLDSFIQDHLWHWHKLSTVACGRGSHASYPSAQACQSGAMSSGTLMGVAAPLLQQVIIEGKPCSIISHALLLPAAPSRPQITLSTAAPPAPPGTSPLHVLTQKRCPLRETSTMAQPPQGGACKCRTPSYGCCVPNTRRMSFWKGTILGTACLLAGK